MEAWRVVVLVGLLGLVSGSFAAAAAWRLPRELPILRARSSCPSCGHVLGALDLVPLLSWLVSHGHCRYCRQTVSSRYPLIEALTGLLFVVALGASEPAAPQSLVLLWISITGLVIAGVADWESGIIPNEVLFVLVPVALLWRWESGGNLVEELLTGAATGGLIFALREGFRRLRGIDGLGMGDVKFLAMAGLYLEPLRLTAFVMVAAVLGIILGGLWRLAGRGPAFPFGPALVAALLVALLAPQWLDALLTLTQE